MTLARHAEQWLRFRRRVERIGLAEYESLMPYPVPLKLWFGAGSPKRLFYCTKATFINYLWKQALFPEDWLAIERPLVPTRHSITATRAIAEAFNLPLVFLGDLIPMDLTIFALLRRGGEDFSSRGARPLPVHYAGINDEWLSLSDEMRLPKQVKHELQMRRFEREHYEILRPLVPDLAARIGPHSFGLLQSGQLVHMEMTLGQGGYKKGSAQRFITLLNRAADRARRARVSSTFPRE